MANDPSDPQNLIRKNAHTGMTVLAVVIGMIGLSFASVPLYRLFCQVTGFGGTPQVSEQWPEKTLDRVVTIKFIADTDRNLPWRFRPEQKQVDVRLGQKGITAFHATNRSNESITGTAVYNVSPNKAGKYFHKVQCFCFGEQTLKANEDVSMPVLFFVDPSMNDDENMEDVTTITLSYTFYEAGSAELDQAMEGLYNSP